MTDLTVDDLTAMNDEPIYRDLMSAAQVRAAAAEIEQRALGDIAKLVRSGNANGLPVATLARFGGVTRRTVYAMLQGGKG